MECDDERLCHDGPREEAIELYYQMKVASTQPNNITFPIVLKACANYRHSKKVWKSMDVIKRGFDSNVFTRTTLLTMYVKCSCIEFAC